MCSNKPDCTHGTHMDQAQSKKLTFDPRFFSKIRGEGVCSSRPQDYAASRDINPNRPPSPKLWCPSDAGTPCSSFCTTSSRKRNHCAVDLVADPDALVYAPFCGVVTMRSEHKTKCTRNFLDIKADPDSEFKGYWVRLLYARPAPEIRAQTKVRDRVRPWRDCSP